MNTKKRPLVASLLASIVCWSGVFAQDQPDRGQVKDSAQTSRRVEPIQNAAETKKQKGDGRGKAAKNSRKSVAINTAREAAVIAFVAKHHPELTELLVYLKKNRSGAYLRAVRDLFRVSERLAQIQETNVSRYELELKLWKAESRTQLLAARLKMSSTPKLKTQLHDVLGVQLDLRLEIARLERERQQQRLEKMDANISRMERNRESAIRRQLATLTGDRKRGKPKTRPVAKTKDNGTSPAKSTRQN